MTQQPEASQPAPQQGLLGAERGSSGGGGAPAGLLEGHGGAAVQVSVDEALAAPDVVHPPQGRVSSVRQGEAGLLLRDAADALVTKVTLEDVAFPPWSSRNG